MWHKYFLPINKNDIKINKIKWRSKDIKQTPHALMNMDYITSKAYS